MVLHDYSLKEYCNTLLSNLGGQLQLKLSNQFFQSQLKTRIKMMNKNTKTKEASFKYYGVLPIIFGLILAFSKDNINQINPTDEVSVVNKSELQDDGPEEMPRFPGCEDVANMEERKSCAMTKLIEFLSENIVYPQEAKINNIEGMNVAKFVVGKDGTLENIELLKDIGYGTGESTLNAVRSMNEKGLKWIPGKKDGKAVRVEFTLPIKYKLTDEDKKK